MQVAAKVLIQVTSEGWARAGHSLEGYEVFEAAAPDDYAVEPAAAARNHIAICRQQ